MAVLTVDRHQAQIPAPGSNPAEMNYTHPGGTDNAILVCVTLAGNTTINGATFGGSPMVVAGSKYFSFEDQTQYFFFLKDAPSGSLELLSIQIDGSFWLSSVSTVIMSFTGVVSFSLGTFNEHSTGPHIQTVTTEDGSVLYGTCISSFATTGIEFDDIQATPLMPNNHNTNDIVSGAWSPTLTAGDHTVKMEITNGEVTNSYIEIKGSGVSPVSRRIFIIS